MTEAYRFTNRPGEEIGISPVRLQAKETRGTRSVKSGGLIGKISEVVFTALELDEVKIPYPNPFSQSAKQS